jgi:hypothetical protein
MCIRFPKQQEPEPQKGPPPITPRVEKDTSVLPKGRSTKDVLDKEKGVAFGSSKKQGAGITTKAKGTEALRIPLNVGSGTTGGGTGVNP